VQKMYDAKFFGIENLSLKMGEDNAVFIFLQYTNLHVSAKEAKAERGVTEE